MSLFAEQEGAGGRGIQFQRWQKVYHTLFVFSCVKRKVYHAKLEEKTWLTFCYLQYLGTENVEN
jgi:hypothetical protein